MPNTFQQVITEDVLQRRIAELGEEITNSFPDEDVVVIGILKAGLFFMKDLLDQLPLTYTAEFMGLTRFGHDGKVSVAMDVSIPLEGRDVLLVLDLVDTGLTLATIKRMMGARGPRTLRTAALLDKVPRRIVDVDVDFRGFEVGDEYLLGYGLDYEGLHRNVPSVWAVMDFPKFAENPRAFDAVGYRRGELQAASSTLQG